MEKNPTFFRELLRPWWVRIGFLLTVAIPSYDGISNQFGWPKIPRLLGMTGSLLPWWGWLLVFQAVLIAALFAYVRRNLPVAPVSHEKEIIELSSLVHGGAERTKEIERSILSLEERVEKQNSPPGDLLAMHLEASEMDKKVRGSVGSDLEKIVTAIREIKLDIENQKWATLAIYHRERMLDLAAQIDTLGNEVGLRDDLSREFDEDEFDQWEGKFLQWRGILSKWCHYASFYVGRDPQNDIERIDENGLNENWGVKSAQFPDGGVIKYKTFRIYLRNWSHVRDAVHQKVRMQAFEGQQTNTRERYGID